VWYFPLRHHLQRYFADPKEAKLMLWHTDRKAAVLLDPKWVEEPVLTHPSDAGQWRALDEEYYKEFGRDPRNISLGASTDGLNPFGNQSSKHNTWPVFVWMYNIPLVVPEEEVHTHEYANSRADTARERYQPVSRVVERRARHLVGGRGRNMGRPQGRNFLSQIRAAHDGAGLSWIRIYCVRGVPRTQGLCEVHGIDAIYIAG
jgi:hypothetical protein